MNQRIIIEAEISVIRQNRTDGSAGSPRPGGAASGALVSAGPSVIPEALGLLGANLGLRDRVAAVTGLELT